MLIGASLRWELTMHCNLACRHCQVGQHINHRHEHPSLDLVMGVIEALDRKLVSQIGLLGGEPLSYPHIDQVIERLVDTCIPVTISTNGLLVDRPLADLLRESYRWSVMVSLEGPDKETHELIRGKGTFKRTVENTRRLVDWLADTDVEVGVSFTLNRFTIPRMGKMLQLARELGVSVLQFQDVKEAGNAACDFHELKIDQGALIEALVGYFQEVDGQGQGRRPQVIFDFLDNPLREVLNERAGAELPLTVSGCAAAGSSAAVDCDGRFWPCPSLSREKHPKIVEYFDFEKNSLLENDFTDIWNSEGFRKLRDLNSRRLHARRADPCRDCRHNQLCSPCPLPFLVGESLDQPRCRKLFAEAIPR
ncbi:MAG: radical SAM protein [Deltaproteobacteria bacterium]|nr:radical SAM protein [Deltaproteobacteria bacterium]